MRIVSVCTFKSIQKAVLRIRRFIPRLMDPDPDSYTDPDPDVYPDPVIFVSDLQDLSQKFYFFLSFLLITFEGTFT
jgi:hypothetical protein